MDNKELIEYLQQFPDNAQPSFIIANPKERLFYQPVRVCCITDDEIPVFCIEVGPAQNMDEELVRACEEDEAQAPILKELESKKKNFEECVSSKEVELAREWNKAVEPCMYGDKVCKYEHDISKGCDVCFLEWLQAEVEDGA